MGYRNLEITVQQAKDLSNVNLISKMDAYAVVSIVGGDESLKQKTRTPVDHAGNTNPTWNFPMKFTVDEAALQANRLTLDFKLVCERALGDKEIGFVHVPIKELLDTQSFARQFVSYQVRKPTGKPKGHLHFSYLFAPKITASAAAPPNAAAVPFNSEPVMAYPTGSSSAHPSYPPVAFYPPIGGGAPPEGKDHYPPATVYPPIGGGAPPPSAYPVVDPPAALYPPIGGGAQPPAAYPVVDVKDHYPPAALYPPIGLGAPAPAAYPPTQSEFGGYPPPPPSGYGYPPPPTQGYGYPPPPMQLF